MTSDDIDRRHSSVTSVKTVQTFSFQHSTSQQTVNKGINPKYTLIKSCLSLSKVPNKNPNMVNIYIYILESRHLFMENPNLFVFIIGKFSTGACACRRQTVRLRAASFRRFCFY